MSTPRDSGTLVTRLTEAGLTDRERVVLARLRDERTLRQIAADLYVSRNTVKTQVRSLYRKLGVSSRAAAVERWREAGLGAVERSREAGLGAPGSYPQRTELRSGTGGR